ncbi:hypothetical protein AHF37_12424 [Paragonimus kellicotti]|nr:hypothetical protein AHF37_12424 [Paragonimus kellicotti]
MPTLLERFASVVTGNVQRSVNCPTPDLKLVTS